MVRASRAAAPEQIAEPAEKGAAERPADEKRGLNVGAFILHRRVGRARSGEQRHHQRGGDERVKMELKTVEEPSQPRGDARFSLQRREEARRVASRGAGVAVAGREESAGRAADTRANCRASARVTSKRSKRRDGGR